MGLLRVKLGVIAAASLLVVLAGCAGSGGPKEFRSAEEIDMQKIICRSEKPTGSRIAKRVCKTEGEWLAEAEESKELMRNRDRGPTSPAEFPSIGN